MSEPPGRKYCIIVAGGNGSRMSSPVAKQFLKLGGTPILIHTIQKFFNLNLGIRIILVLPKSQIDFWNQLCEEFHFQVPVSTVFGGETRFHSVKNGLELVQEDGIVAVHDAVRPLVSAKTITSAYHAAQMYGSAVPAIPLHDSIRQIESSVSIAVDRTLYAIIQTPQCFTTEILKKAYRQEYKYTFTDDASVVEAAGEQIRLIDGNLENIKITTPLDLQIAGAILGK